MTIEELAEQVAVRLAGRDTYGRRTPRFARVQDTWLARHPRNFEWTVVADPLTPVLSAISDYLMEQAGKLPGSQYRALIELCADEGTPGKVLALLAVEPILRLETVQLSAPGNEEWLYLIVGRPIV